MRRSRIIPSLLAVLTVLAVAPAGAAEPSGAGTDVVFLVDASGSVESTDPHAARRTVIRAIIDLALRRGGDRVAVYRFAGRRETAERVAEAETLPLTAVPTDATRDEILARLHEAAGRAAEIFPGAMATDFNAAIEVGLARILKQRGDCARPLWIVLLSDGDSEVERGAAAHAAYVAEAKRRYGKTLTRYLNKAATDLLREQVLPALEGPGRFFTAINVAAPEVSDGDALAAVAACGRGGEVLRVTDHPLRDLVLPAFRTAPGRLGRPVARGIAYEQFSVDGTADRSFRTCGRLGRTGLLVFADSSDYTVELARPGGEPLTEGSIEVSGQGERYRVVTVAGLPAGEYRLRIKSPRVIRAERILYHEMDVSVRARLTSDRTVFRPGETVEFEAALVDDATGRVVVDADVLADCRIAVRVESPAGLIEVGEASLAGAPDGTARLSYAIPAGAERGACVVDVRAIGLMDPDGESGLKAETRDAGRFEVIPALAVSFEAGEIEVSVTAGLRGQPPAGRLPRESVIPVRLVDQDGASRTASLRYSEDSGAWVATVSDLAEGTWTVTTPPEARVDVLPGKVATLRVVTIVPAAQIPWKMVLLALLILVLGLALLGVLRSTRRRRTVDLEEAEAVEGGESWSESFGGPGDDDDIDQEDLLLDDDDMEEYLAGVSVESTVFGEEEGTDDESPTLMTADDPETLILDE